jgi:hypothetical protein
LNSFRYLSKVYLGGFLIINKISRICPDMTLIINGTLMVTGRPMVITAYAGPIAVLVVAPWVLALGMVKLVRRRKETAVKST